MYDPLPYLVKPYAREPYGPIRLGLALHFKHHFYEVLAHTQSVIAPHSAAGSIVGPSNSINKSVGLRVAFPNTFSGDRKKFKSFFI